ncbi:MAG: ATP-dependent Clp protease adaptor ClpS [Planctomycetes bacterium]|nr:ATP-dependent Clp protease adaptor ClpS [Planctomycetota bacterium]NOG54330.1 ATP-dependent Clp protease adaptor ClpS [Planctomycetota bacterium]
MGKTKDTTSTPQGSTRTKEKVKDAPQTKQPSQWNVVLHDDDDHSYGYVMGMLVHLFGVSIPASYQMACEVDKSGRVICTTTYKEKAELKREQIHEFGADPAIPKCKGAMTATIEQVPGGNGGNKGGD